MFNPKVSVIIPCYNHQDYIKQSINSVLSQTYTNIELIVIDDGSIDGSRLIINQLNKDNKFIYIEQSNQGICKTLNKAINDFSTGDYIAILASDDYWLENKVQLQIQELSKNKDSSFCYSKAREFESDSNKTIRIFPRYTYRGNLLHRVFINQHVPAGSIMFKRALFDKLKGFDETLKEEDWDFVIRAAANTPFCSVSKPLLQYRSHKTNTMKLRSRKLIFHQKVLILAKNYTLVNPMIWITSIIIHYIYDHLLSKFKNIRGNI